MLLGSNHSYKASEIPGKASSSIWIVGFLSRDPLPSILVGRSLISKRLISLPSMNSMFPDIRPMRAVPTWRLMSVIAST